MAKSASENAAEGLARIGKHEAVCTERWSEAKKSLDNVIAAQSRAFWWMIGLLGGTCAAVILALATILMHALIKAGVL